MISIRDLSVSYGKNTAIERINLEIHHQETLGLIGLNGAGKTTLIKTILGLRTPNTGQITYDHQAEKQKNTIKNSIAYLPERFDPPSFLRGGEFVHFSASLYRKRLSELEISAMAESLELDPVVLRRSVNTYSKGMRQKLGLIATILTGCDLLILDEPMSGLDPQARACVKNNIVSLKKEGRTVFLSPHILSDMSEICDRVAVLYDKTIQFTGRPEEMTRLYNADTLEKAFLNLIESRKYARLNMIAAE